MLRSWLGSGILRSLRVQRLNPLLPLARNARFSTAPKRYLQPPGSSADRVPLRKQLKQEAKALRSHKKQRKEDEEASRQEWELTVGLEIHAQLDTEAKLFSRTPPFFWFLGNPFSQKQNRSRDLNE
jgi:aspartyl-tRNA(Asn)/glutamyl-tRNA(Gln) amidotransferase subunit B